MVAWFKKGAYTADKESTGKALDIQSAAHTLCIILSKHKPGYFVCSAARVRARLPKRIRSGFHEAPG
eukprot:6532200-Prymnesium_polylepis.1